MEVFTLPCPLCCGRQWVNLGFLLVFMLCLQPTAPARIGRIGNDIKPSASGVDVAGAVFLLEDPIVHDGVLFAYSAHFRSDKPISLQVWRPLGPGQMYKLVFNLRVVPAGIFQREDIYVVSKLVGGDCALVQPGDRVGVLFLEAPGAIAYTFQPNQAGALGSTLKQDKTNVTIGMELEFEALTFPYEFSMAGYIDTNMSMYSLPANLTSLTIVALPCPIGLKIPSYGDLATPPPPVPVTGKPGEPGAPGPPGVDGLPGLPGQVGPIGPQGPSGFNGSRGQQGPRGLTGLRGPLGNQGPRGFEGPPGAAGPKGDKGDMGLAGPTGPAGKDGRSGNAVDKTAASRSSEDGFLSSTMFSILLLVWMIVITVTIFILICLFICVAKRNRRHYGSSRSTSTSKQDISWGGGDMGHDNLYIAYMPDRNETDSAKAASSAGTRTLPHKPEQLPPPPPPEVSATSTSAAGLRRSRSGNVSEFSYSHLANSGEGFKGETTKEFPIETVSPDEGSTSRPVSSSRHGEFVLAPDPAYYTETPHRDYNKKYIHTNGTTPNGRHDYNYRM